MTRNRCASMLGLALALSLEPAFATTYTTTGCFSNPNVSDASTSASAVCTAGGSSFIYNDIAGSETITFTNGSSAPDPSGVIDLGTFTLSTSGSGSGNTFGADFSLSFTSPASTTGTFEADLSGSFGNSTVLFNSTTQTFITPNGTFDVTLQMNPVQLSSTSRTEMLTGSLTTVPEPVPLALLGGGFLLFTVARWFRSLKKA